MSAALAGQGLWVLLVVGWYVIRYPFERRARKTRIAHSGRDLSERIRMAVSFTGLGILPGLFVASGLPRLGTYEPSALQTGAGALVAALALYLFRRTHKALGRMWSVSLDIREKHKLVTTGIYERLRHPMYTAFFAMALAQALLVPSAIAGPAGLVGFGLLFAFRIGPEERMMEERFGEDYRAYKARTARILPGLF
ncbi:protein-S-isoprenylcysteine O-methyltransferase [Aurantimonas sp. Leaf443]|uniref:protein-S-isoprenylcysteine O-methyltransferase n=1 Tax=Aurantimonas sp. Leaf443 TaxID=1736378 RepID=UPI0007021DD1|nr:protein-S-isoprenylcysteine O-methyltransferase [Aurantimonas sp. Leaf443]KQT85450.1 methyltransferase [Aurantimonas sp. Leaf443]